MNLETFLVVCLSFCVKHAFERIESKIDSLVRLFESTKHQSASFLSRIAYDLNAEAWWRAKDWNLRYQFSYAGPWSYSSFQLSGLSLLDFC